MRIFGMILFSSQSKLKNANHFRRALSLSHAFIELKARRSGSVNCHFYGEVLAELSIRHEFFSLSFVYFCARSVLT